MKKPWYTSLRPPVAAIAVGAVLLLGVLLVWQLDRMGDRRERKGKA